ncbi:conserved membrane hypothetical protein [Gammaproteobacteria bacterium]
MLDLLSVIVHAALVVSIPVLVANGGEAVMHVIANHEFHAIPILTTLARLQGLLAGGLLLHASFDESYYDLQALFVPASRWNLTMNQFLLERANLFAYDPEPLLNLLREQPWSGRGLLVALVVVVIPTLLVMMCLRFWKLWDALRGMVACAGTALWSAWITVYLVCLVFWGLYLLNYWSLALLAVYIQYQRSRGGHH